MWKTYCPYCHGYTKDDERGNCAACGAQRIHTSDTSPLPKEIPEKSWSESPSTTSSEEASKSLSWSKSPSVSNSPSLESDESWCIGTGSPSPENDEVIEEPISMDESRRTSFSALLEWIKAIEQQILKARTNDKSD